VVVVKVVSTWLTWNSVSRYSLSEHSLRRMVYAMRSMEGPHGGAMSRYHDSHSRLEAKYVHEEASR